MNAFQTCRNTSDVVPLYLPQHLYLKPSARLIISLQLPNVKKLEKSVSHWEIMEKLRILVKPDEFSVLKVTKTTIEFVRFEAEIDNKTRLERVISKLDNNSIKLKDIPDLIRIKAAEYKSDYPTRHKWDEFFQEAKDMDEMKPGQRPDTLHISNLPIKWFVHYHMNDDEDVLPSEKMFYRIFEKFGQIRYVDIPICDPYRKKMKDHISGFKIHTPDDKEFFEGYVQFKDYMGFTKSIDALKGMKLLKKKDDEAICINIKVDFDRSKHLSDASLRRREIVRDRLVRKQREKEEKEKNELEAKKKREINERQQEIVSKNEKEKRRREREEKRKAKLLEKLKGNGCDDINIKIAKEEKKLLKAQRKLEAIRLIEELFRRIKEKKDECNISNKAKGGDELKRYKDMSELEVLTRRQKLHNAIEGRIILKSILSDTKKSRKISSSSETSLSPDEDDKGGIPEAVFDPSWYPYPYPTPLYPPLRGAYSFRGRLPRLSLPGPSRGRRRGRGYRSRYRGGYRGGYAPEVEDEYIKYFSKFFTDHDRRSRSRSKSQKSYSRSRSRSRRKSYSRSRSYSKSRSKSYSPRRSRKSSRKRKTRSRSESVDSTKFVSPKSLRRMKSRTRSRSWSMPRSSDKGRRSWSRSPEKK